MTRNRFELLQTFLHFNNTANQVPKGEDGYNPLFKIQPLLDICNPPYEKVYQPKMCLSIDESMIKFKGHVFFRQYLLKKPTKWGIKAILLRESESGYCLINLFCCRVLFGPASNIFAYICINLMTCEKTEISLIPFNILT